MNSTSEQEAAWTVGRLLDWTTRWFDERSVEGGRLAAELLLAHAMDCRKIDLYTRYMLEPTEPQRTTFRDLVRRAGEHTPIAYLLGHREFFSMDFDVSPAVLIPRPETEVLVQRVLHLCRDSRDRVWDVLDVGTGSGCVALAIARYADNTRVVATDVSAEALAVAQGNAERHDLTDRVTTVRADGVDLPEEAVPTGGFDIIVSNPPYISSDVFPTLPPNVRDHEPRIALVPEEGDGLHMYRRFAERARRLLRPDGRIICEIGHDQHQAVLDTFAAAPGWSYAGSHRERSDPHDRAVEFTVA